VKDDLWSLILGLIMSEQRFNSFEEFWPYYVAEHSQPATRALHAVGTTAAVTCVAALIAKRKWKLLPLALLPGYGAAWISHFFIEKNKPATFDYPLWSFIADYKMVGLMIAGKMDDEVERVIANKERG
jgi:hypothetical protein